MARFGGKFRMYIRFYTLLGISLSEMDSFILLSLEIVSKGNDVYESFDYVLSSIGLP